MGTECGVCFDAVPERVSFLAGALEHEVALKCKKPRARRQKVEEDEQIEEVLPESVKNNEKGDADKLSAMEKLLRQIRKKLTARTKEETKGGERQHPDIDGLQFLMNPKSFTQSVENIFNFSFLIKKGEAEIGVNDDDEQLFVAQRSLDPDTLPHCTQAVCSFTMADWRRLSAGLECGDLAHRTGSKHNR